jgi:hypothetical protein
MPMPPQLARAKRPKRSSPRPIVEQLPRIDITDLCRWNVFPNQCDWNKAHLLELPFRYPFIQSLVISLQSIEANHLSGYTQVIPLRWIRTGYGGHHRPRPLFVCQCGRSVRRVYFKGGHLACRRCHSAVYASQLCSGRTTRSALQALRLQTFLGLKSYMWKNNRQRLKARLATTPKQEFKSKRLAHHAIQLPQSNYGTRGAMHWR